MINVIKMICEHKEKKLREDSLRLGEILVEAGLLTREELKKALEKQAGTGKSLGAHLINEGIITGEGVARALGYQLKIPEDAGTGGSGGK
jgi:hypothetical protein